MTSVRHMKRKGTNHGVIKASNKDMGEGRPVDQDGPRIIYDFKSRRQNVRLLLMGFLLSVLVLVTFWKSFGNNFVDWDDFTYVVNNDLVRHPGDKFLKDIFDTPVSSNYHPLTILTMRLNNNICKTCPNGISPLPFIRWNVILHLLNTILVLILVYLLSDRNLFVAFFTAAVFGIHPMHVESVAWISERKDVLYTFFFLLGLIAYTNYKRVKSNKYIWLAVTFLLFLFSCLSKATAVVFPLVLILINFWFSGYRDKSPLPESLKKTFSLKNVLLLIPFLIVSFVVGMLAFRLQSGHNFLGILDLGKVTPDVVNKIGPFTLWHRFQIGCYGFIAYIVKFFIPVHLSSFYPYPGLKEFDSQTLPILIRLAPAAFILLFIPVILSARRTKLFIFGVGFYLVTIMLVLQFISVGYAIIADRYSYIPYIGLAFITATLIDKVPGIRKQLLYVFSGCLIVVLIIMSRNQIALWNNTETLWTNVINKFPHVEISRRSRGKYYSKLAMSARNDVARREYQNKALIDFKEAIRSGSKNSEVYEGAGVIYGSTGDFNNAILCLNNAAALDPKSGSIYFNRAFTLSNMNRNEEAIRDYNMALICAPQDAVKILTNRSNLFLASGRFKEAIADLNYLISTDPGNFLFYYDRAFASEQTHDTAGAISDYRKALQLQPGDQITKEQLQKLLSGRK